MLAAVVGAAVVVGLLLASLGADDGAGPATSSSPALRAADVDGLPSTVAELPVTDAAGFRQLLDDLRGTPVVVSLWASWCEPCTREMPRLAEAARSNPDVQFLGVDTLDSRDGAERFIERFDVPFPSLFDPDAAIRTDLGGSGLPITVFIDAAGEQVAMVVGELSQADLDEQLTAIAG